MAWPDFFDGLKIGVRVIIVPLSPKISVFSYLSTSRIGTTYLEGYIV